MLKKWIRSGFLRCVHFGTPCTSFSQALRGRHRKRSLADPVGPERSDEKVLKANMLVRWTVQLCWECHKARVGWSIENPAGSLLWHMPEVMRLADHGISIVLDQC